MILMIVLMYAAIGGVELPYLIKNRRTKELIAFTILFILGFTYLLLTFLDVPMPRVMHLVDWFFEEVLHIGYKK